MSREYRISWNENQLRKLNSAVRKYNNALRRAAKADPLAHIYLPQEVSYKELKSSITTARALKNTVNRLTRVTRPKALEPVQQQDGSIVTRYERHEYAVLRSVRERKKSMRAKAEGVVQPTAGAGNLKQAALSRDARPVSTLGAGAMAFHRDAIASTQHEQQGTGAALLYQLHESPVERFRRLSRA